MSVDGVNRRVRVHLPPDQPAGRPLPVLLAYHGLLSDGRFMERYTGFSALADQQGFIVAYPSALAGRWHMSARAGIVAEHGVDFARELLDRLQRAWTALARSRRACPTGPPRSLAWGVSSAIAWTGSPRWLGTTRRWRPVARAGPFR